MTFDKNAYYKEYDKKYYANPENRARRNERQKARRVANPERTLLDKARSRAKELGRDFNLDLEDISIPACCPILGIPLVRGEGKVHAASPVLDRIDNNRGYIKGNVAVISQRANQMKTDCSVDQLKKLIEYMTPKSD